jgi:hypothetical protein
VSRDEVRGGSKEDAGRNETKSVESRVKAELVLAEARAY